MNKWYEKFISKIAPFVIFFAGIIIILLVVTDIRGTSRQNNGYVRVINCIVEVPATVRTEDDIDHCYEVVEKDLGITLKRYSQQ